MINIKSKYGGVESHIEGSTPVVTAEAIAANVALTKAIAEIKGVSFENAALFIMQMNSVNLLKGLWRYVIHIWGGKHKEKK